jgi:hypothetical protein
MRSGAGACHMLHALIAQRTNIDTVQQMLAGTKQDGRDGQVQLVDEGSAKILPDRGNAATQPDIATVRRIPRLLQRGVNTVGDEAKHRAALHHERRSRVMSQHEDRRVIRRLVTPPAFPAVIQPWASDGAEHVSTENLGADPGEPLRRDVVIDACFAIFISVHPLPGPRVEEPIKQFRTADSKRIL